MYPLTDKEGTVINNIREDFFADYDCRKLIGNIDFSVAIRKDRRDLFPEVEYLLWAEAKAGNRHSIYDSFIQLILTIGRERTIDKLLPPKFLGALDAEKIAFIPYSAVMEVFSQNDFNWNVAPTDHESKQFKQLKELVRRRLVIYINPPYKEATNARTITGTGNNQAGATIETATYLKYKNVIGIAGVELFAQFFIRIYHEIPGAVLA